MSFNLKLDEAIHDDLACDIVMRHVSGANGLVAVFGIHQILQKMREGKYTEEHKIGYCNLKMQRKEDDVSIITKDKKERRYNIFTYHLDKMLGIKHKV